MKRCYNNLETEAAKSLGALNEKRRTLVDIRSLTRENYERMCEAIKNEKYDDLGTPID